MTGTFHVSTHPLVWHKLNWLRQPMSVLPSREYANLLQELGMMLAMEATAKMPLLRSAESKGSNGIQKIRWPVIVVIVRSGLIMAEGVRQIIPTRHVGHIGLFHDHEAKQLKEFMVTMPFDIEDRQFIIVDPFVDTGQSAGRAIKIITEYGVPTSQISFVCCCVSKQGYKMLREDAFGSEVDFFCGRVDGLVKDDDEIWFTSFIKLYERLYGTRNRKLSFEPPK